MDGIWISERALAHVQLWGPSHIGIFLPSCAGWTGSQYVYPKVPGIHSTPVFGVVSYFNDTPIIIHCTPHIFAIHVAHGVKKHGDGMPQSGVEALVAENRPMSGSKARKMPICSRWRNTSGDSPHARTNVPCR